MNVLEIAHTWDGRALPRAARTALSLRWAGPALRLEVEAPFAGDPAPPVGKGSTPRLWEHEVVELFVFGADGRYTEIELGPHGHWLVLRLDGVRAVVDEGHAIDWSATIQDGRWSGIAEVDRLLLPAHPVRCNAFRISGVGAVRRYDALVAVPGEVPDFHQPDRGMLWPL